MVLRRGSSLLSTVLTIAAVGAVGAAGVMTMTGNGLCSLMGGDSCATACDDTHADAQVIAASGVAADRESKGPAGSCCPLGDLAKRDAQVIPAADTTEKTNCSDKAACDDTDKVAQCGESQVIAASNTANKTTCSDKSNCGDKMVRCGGAQVIAAADSDKASTCGDKSNCGDKVAQCGGAVIQAASMSKADACGPCPVATFQTRLVAFSTMLKKNAAADDCCGTPCTTACSEAGAMASASERSDDPVAGHMLSTSGLVIPAMFFSGETLDRSSLTAADCCRSKALNVSATSECGEAKSCCDKGEANVINASTTETASCSDSAACADMAACGEKKATNCCGSCDAPCGERAHAGEPATAAG